MRHFWAIMLELAVTQEILRILAFMLSLMADILFLRKISALNSCYCSKCIQLGASSSNNYHL